ncbi:hypothetical protein Pelo_4139 [Pelomyxa schiedti]|nr:hypothetical protein Pelo_4139 [Pelomyxa schiedti]
MSSTFKDEPPTSTSTKTELEDDHEHTHVHAHVHEHVMQRDGHDVVVAHAHPHVHAHSHADVHLRKPRPHDPTADAGEPDHPHFSLASAPAPASAAAPDPRHTHDHVHDNLAGIAMAKREQQQQQQQQRPEKGVGYGDGDGDVEVEVEAASCRMESAAAVVTLEGAAGTEAEGGSQAQSLLGEGAVATGEGDAAVAYGAVTSAEVGGQLQQLQPQQPVRFWKRRAFWGLVGRIALRVVALTVIVILVWKLPVNWGALLDAYLEWVSSLGPALGPIVYCFLATIFCSVSPTGYAPAVVAGVTFGYYVGPALAYVSVNIGAVLNFLWVRKTRTLLLRINRIRRFIDAKTGRFESIELLLEHMPFRTVLLMRLPYMANGTINYVLSISSVRFLPMVFGNALGFIPGSVLFSVMGTQVQSLRKLIETKAENKTGLIIFVVICVVTVMCLAILVILCRRLMKRAQSRFPTTTPSTPAQSAADQKSPVLVQDDKDTDTSSQIELDVSKV